MPDPSDPDWAALAPELREREAFLRDLARQVRIHLHAGKSDAEVGDWLQELGLSADAAAHFLATCPRGESRAENWVLELLTGPDSYTPRARPSPDDRDRRRERQERWKKSRHLAATEPDADFALPDDSYAQVLTRDTRRGGRGLIVTVVVAVLVLLPFGLTLLILSLG